MKIKIQELAEGVVSGVRVAKGLPPTTQTDYFEWTANPLSTLFQSNEITGGFLVSHRKPCRFTKAETHVDDEIFFFLSGVGLMLFVDYKDGKPDMATAQIVRIHPGTVLVIEKGKGHFVCIAEGDEPVCSVVCAPPMDAPSVELDEEIEGIC